MPPEKENFFSICENVVLQIYTKLQHTRSQSIKALQVPIATLEAFSSFAHFA